MQIPSCKINDKNFDAVSSGTKKWPLRCAHNKVLHISADVNECEKTFGLRCGDHRSGSSSFKIINSHHHFHCLFFFNFLTQFHHELLETEAPDPFRNEYGKIVLVSAQFSFSGLSFLVTRTLQNRFCYGKWCRDIFRVNF